LALAILLRLATPASAQDAAAPYTLHAYANLVQVPALILSSDFQPMPPLDRRQIFLRLDSGPAFHPVRMHLEGDEPLSISILLDASEDHDALLHHFAPALASLARNSLLPHDHVSLYAVDCRLIRSAFDVPPDPALLQSAIEHVLAAPTLHQPAGGPASRIGCQRSLKLWDAAARTVAAMASLPGRKVLLLVSAGADHGSTEHAGAVTWNTVLRMAHENSVAVFGLRDLMRYLGDVGGFGDRAMLISGVYMAVHGPTEDGYIQLCASSGGLLYTTLSHDLERSMTRIVAMLRGRYIVEFPRPDDRNPGAHDIDITLEHASAYIVSAGVSMPLPDAARYTDPTTVPSSPSPAVMGKRRPLNTPP
jgi:hypothetical protein